MKVTRPMLATTAKDLNKIKFPVLASPKLDGFRCTKVDGKALARSFKPIPNHFVRKYIEKNLPEGIDGELMLRDPNATFNQISSALRKYDGEPDFVFHIFDLIGSEGFKERVYKASKQVNQCNDPRLKMVEHIMVHNLEQLRAFEEICLAKGYEGAMIRSLDGPYKCGRSTEKEGYLLKLKRFVDSEAEILGFVELKHNTNEKQTNELGLSFRSHDKEGMVPAGMLGKFEVRDLKTGVEFEVGTGLGLTQELRKEIWENKDKYLGEYIKYKYQKIGMKDKPRSPIWLGFRAKEDM